MIVELKRRQTIKLEGHITITFAEGSQVDLPDDIAEEGLSEGWCHAIADAPGPDEAAVAKPAETKRKKA